MMSRTRIRRTASLEVDAVIGERVVQSETVNISATGVFIKTGMNFGPGEDVRLVFAMPGPNGSRPVKLRGRTVRNDAKGVCVQFVGVSPYFTDILDDAVQGLGELSRAA